MKDNTIDMVAGGHCVVDENGNITEKFDLISRGCDREIAGKKQKETFSLFAHPPKCTQVK